MQSSITSLLTRIAMRSIITDSSCTSWHGVVAVVVVIIVITVSRSIVNDCSLTQCDQQRDEILFQQLHYHGNVSIIDHSHAPIVMQLISLPIDFERSDRDCDGDVSDRRTEHSGTAHVSTLIHHHSHVHSQLRCVQQTSPSPTRALSG